MIARKWKLLLAAMAAAALTVALLRAMYSYSAQADLQNALSNDVPPLKKVRSYLPARGGFWLVVCLFRTAKE